MNSLVEVSWQELGGDHTRAGRLKPFWHAGSLVPLFKDVKERLPEGKQHMPWGDGVATVTVRAFFQEEDAAPYFTVSATFRGMVKTSGWG